MTHALREVPLSGAPSFFGMERAELSRHLASSGSPAYRADQLFSWIYQKHLHDPESMTNLPAAFRRGLGELCDLSLPVVRSVQSSRDGATHKFALGLADGSTVECVSMRTERRLTLCLSSQVGCALKCSFCATGLMGLKRNLRAEEIVGQVLVMGAFHHWQDDRFNRCSWEWESRSPIQPRCCARFASSTTREE